MANSHAPAGRPERVFTLPIVGHFVRIGRDPRKFGRYFAGVADKQNGLNGNRERLSPILAVISGVFRTVAALRGLKAGKP